jgi:hypothetical protein
VTALSIVNPTTPDTSSFDFLTLARNATAIWRAARAALALL